MLLNFRVTSEKVIGDLRWWALFVLSKHLTISPGTSRFISCVGDLSELQRPKLVLCSNVAVYLGRLIGEAAQAMRDQAKIQFSQLNTRIRPRPD